ncbi:hypothetical protein CHUAL_004903 [Chamberlinius hualienensis]
MSPRLRMHFNILKRTCFTGKKKFMFLMLCVGSVFIYNRIFTAGNVQHKEVVHINELIDNDAPGYKPSEVKKRISSLSVGDKVENCGLPMPCPLGSFPVHIYTGKSNADSPRLCVGGTYVFGKNLNNPGRGLNLALVDSNTSTVFRVRNFDTYESDPTQLEMFLEKYLGPRDILIIFTNDEASTKLSGLSRNILQSLGSGSIQNLKFRSSWYMVTQKGIKGFTPFEKLSIAANGKSWGDIFDEKLCIPYKIAGQSIHPDLIAQGNKERRDFCSAASGYGEFCSGLSADTALIPIELEDRSLLDHPIFSVPIAVLSGISLHSLPLTLETVIRQPGINPKMITVFYMPPLAEAVTVAELFKVKSVSMNSLYSFEDQVEFIFNYTVETHPDASHIIFLEEDLILAPDYLKYMAAMMPLLEKDPTLYSISAWNDNGYKGSSSNSEIVYRVNGFPGLAFMISKTTYIRQMRGQMKQCCGQRPWIGWHLSPDDEVEMVVPDVSRVMHPSYEGLGPHTNMLEELLNRERVTSLLSDHSIENPSDVILSNYEAKIEDLILTAVLLDMSTDQLEKCSQQGQISRSYFTADKSKQRQAFVLYYMQNGRSDLEPLKKLCKCFGLFHADGESPRGLHKGLLRFTIEGHDVLLVSSVSPYYRFKPSYHKPLQCCDAT